MLLKLPHHMSKKEERKKEGRKKERKKERKKRKKETFPLVKPTNDRAQECHNPFRDPPPLTLKLGTDKPVDPP